MSFEETLRPFDEQEENKQKLIQIVNCEVNNVKELYINLSLEERSKQFKSVCLIGVTGHGKSSTGNTLCGKSVFKSSMGGDSETEQLKGYLSSWFQGEKMEKSLFIDTPGLGDSKGRDTEHISLMVQGLKQIGYVNCFLICINSEEPRYSEQLQGTLRLFVSIFGKEYLKNCLLCFTKFSQDKKSQKLRENGKKQTEEQIREFYTQKFINFFQFNLKKEQFTFIDNGVIENGEYEDQEVKKYYENLTLIRQFTNKQKAFFCQDIKEVLKENDELKNQIAQQQRIFEDEKNFLLERIEKEKNLQIEKIKAETQQIIKQFQDKVLEKENQYHKLNQQLNELNQQIKQEKEEKQKILENTKALNESHQVNIKQAQSQIIKLQDEIKENQTKSQQNINSQMKNPFSFLSNDNSLEILSDSFYSQKSFMNSSLTKSGDPDMRFSCNRTPGYNKDGTLDMRYKKNRK